MKTYKKISAARVIDCVDIVIQAVGSFYACNYSDNFEDVGKDGCFQTPEGPGLGVRYDWSFINSHKISH